MKVVVVGGSGFIGRHLCTDLARQGYRVVATTRRLERVANMPASIEYLQLDLLEDEASMLDFSGTECVIFLAARTHVLDETECDPIAAYRRLNVDAAVRTATRAAKQGVGRFIYLSSIGVNGLQNSVPFTEADAPDPKEPYAQSKLEAELALRECCRRERMELVILRPVLVYGADAPGNFARLLRAVRGGRFLPLGAIGNSRSLLAVENLVQLVEICIRHPRAANEVFLAADGEDISTADLVREIGVALGKPVRLLSLPLWILRFGARLTGKTRELDRLCGSLRVDIGKARNLLGWKPSLTLRQALQRLER